MTTGEGATGMAAALAALAERWPHVMLVAGDPPGDGGWIGVDELVDGSELDRIVERLLDGQACGARDVAGSYLSGWLGLVLVGPPAAAWARNGRVWPLAAADLAVLPHALGWFDGYAARGGLRPVDVATLADELVALLTPVFAAVRARLPYGLAGMWGAVADGLAEHPALVEAVAARVPRLRARPRFQTVRWSGGEHRAVVRSTCCLWYKVFPGDPDPDGEGYCTSCPHRTDDSRAATIAGRLEAGEPM